MFKLRIETKNSAFEGIAVIQEIERLLNDVTIKLKNGRKEGMLYDINGNKVGEYKLTRR